MIRMPPKNQVGGFHFHIAAAATMDMIILAAIPIVA